MMRSDIFFYVIPSRAPNAGERHVSLEEALHAAERFTATGQDVRVISRMNEAANDRPLSTPTPTPFPGG